MTIPPNTRTAAFNLGDYNVMYFQASSQQCLPHIQLDHSLAYVYSGRLIVHDGESELTGHTGDSIFIRKNHRIRLAMEEDKGIQILFLILDRNVLLEFYQQLCKDGHIQHGEQRFTASFVKLSGRIDVDSLFLSMAPYLGASEQPSDPVLRLKLHEAIHALLATGKGIESVLFDFAAPWKIDILDFLHKNYMYNLSIKEFARYTGRSVASFKRDFNKISEWTPQRWITKKRLETAHRLLNEGKKVSDVYLDLGFTSLSHFSTAYKKEYGVSPTGMAHTQRVGSPKIHNGAIV